MNKKTLIYMIIAFILSFALTFFIIKSLKKKDNQNAIENSKVK